MLPNVVGDSAAEPFYGYVETTEHALRLVHAARQGVIPRITRRLNDSERRTMIKSGAVFVFDVEESGIRRWTEGLLWSPSRIVGNFLVYREINERDNSRGAHQRTYDQDSPAATKTESPTLLPKLPSLLANQGAMKQNGLMKKTITITMDNSNLHLISYYTEDDIKSGKLKKPTSRRDVYALELPPHIFRFTNFRTPPKIETGPDGKARLVSEDDEMESEYSDDSVSLHGSPAISNRQVSLPSTMRERSGSTRHRGFASPLGESSSSAGFSRGSSWGIADRNNYDIARSSARASNSAPWNTASHSSRHSQKHRDIDVGGGSATAPSSWGGLSRHFATADRDSADLRYNGISPAPSSSRTFKHSPSPPISHLYAQRSHLLPSSEDSQRDPASLLHFDYRSAGTNDPLRLQTSATGVGDNFVPDTGSSSWSLPSTGNHHAPGLEWPPTRAQSQYSVDTNTSGYDDFPQRQLAQWSPSDSTPESTYSPLQTLPETPSIGFDEDQSSFASSSGLTRPSEHYSSGFYN